MGPTQVHDHCPVDETGRQLLGAAMRRLRPGDEPKAPAYHRVLKLARTAGCWRGASEPAGAQDAHDPQIARSSIGRGDGG